MELQLENSALQEALRVISRLAVPMTGNVTLQSDGSQFFIHSASEVSRCSVNIPATVTGKPRSFALPLNTLRDATKGRAQLKFTYDKTICNISSGNYKSELATVDAMEVETDNEEKEQKIVLKAEQMVWLKGAVATVAIKPSALVTEFMPVGIKLTKKGAFVACYDANHMAYVNSGEITGDMELRLPLETWTGVLDAFNCNCKIEISKSSMYVTSKLIKVVLALPQESEESALTLSEVIEFAKGSKEATGQNLVFAKAEMGVLLDNSRAVALTKEKAEVRIITEAGKLRMDVTTSNGTVKGVVKCACKPGVKALVDFEFFDEAIRKGPEELTMKVVKDQFLSVKTKSGTVIVSLNQET